MPERSRQTYLEKARATLAAREAWQSVFSPDAPPPRSAVDPGGRLSYSPPSADALTTDEAKPTCDKSDQSPADGRAARDVAWRVEAMRPQVPATGPVPILLARPEARMAPAGTCVSCGDPLDVGRRVRCAPCVRAVERVLNEIREGP